MRIVLDTNVLARANPRTSGAARALIEYIRDSEEHTLILSPFLLTELERVLNYPRLQALWPLSKVEIARYVQALQDFAECVFPASAPGIVAADPDDDPVMATAVAGNADVLCTRDGHFASAAVREYGREHGVELVDDVKLLRRLRSPGSVIQ